MSFFLGVRTENMPGPIYGNPLRCLNEKVCLQTKKVFDACLKREHIEDMPITLTDFTPENPTAPLTFVSGSASTTESVSFLNTQITRLSDRPNFATVSVTAQIPIDVVYTDANGVQGTAKGYITMDESVILFVPQASMVPVQVEPVASVVVPQASFTSSTEILLDACVMLIIKVVANVEILVPSYGYCNIPPCQEASQDVCQGFFELPLFPSSQPAQNTANDNQ
ncbi:MAG: hypothetical protein IJ837_04035 [Clostridia bacterium]|nr:hypothetical protein [Clostridia bacterium]